MDDRAASELERIKNISRYCNKDSNCIGRLRVRSVGLPIYLKGTIILKKENTKSSRMLSKDT